MKRLLQCMLIAAAATGCQHHPERPESRSPDTPPASAILADLAAPNRAIANFAANGVIRMRLPGEAATQRFDRSHVRFVQPDRFFAHAFKAGQNVRLYVDGETFLLEIGPENTFYYGREGDYFEDAALEIAPSVVFRELFLANTMPALPPGRVQVQAYDPARKRAELAVFQDRQRRALERHLAVEWGPSGWQLVESRLFGADGRPVARTAFDDYTLRDGVWMPGHISAALTETEGTLHFTLKSNIRLNRTEPRPVEDIAAVRQQLRAKGFEEVRGLAAGKESR